MKLFLDQKMEGATNLVISTNTMDLKNIFKRKKITTVTKKAKESVDRSKVKVAKKEKPRVIKKQKKTSESIIYRVLKSPHITEKASDLAEKNQYVFKVYPATNKIEIKRAIEQLYSVDVLKVRVIKVPRKQRRVGRTIGWRKGYKKAIVKIREGQKIEVVPR